MKNLLIFSAYYCLVSFILSGCDNTVVEPGTTVISSPQPYYPQMRLSSGPAEGYEQFSQRINTGVGQREILWRRASPNEPWSMHYQSFHRPPMQVHRPCLHR